LRGRAAAALAAACCAALLFSATIAGCGNMSPREYSDAIYSINLKVAEEMNALAARIQEQQMGGMKEASLEGMRISRRMEDVFNSSLQEAQKMKPPPEARELHAGIIELYQRGAELGGDFSAAYEYLYEISDTLDRFFTAGMEVFQVGVLGSDQALLISALDRDIGAARDCRDAVDLEAGDAAPATRDFFRGMFDGLLGILERARAGIMSGDEEARPRLNRELSEFFAGLLQAESEGIPGFAELSDRLLELQGRYHELARMVNDL
jgi:hypothetical protein